ncbi:hypothetical protein SeV_B0393 [Salmonella enterica subsp. enterica serovar Virchow str. SL491]|uniref:Uncharacterized protein n=1 Tax=Salmonella virchow (strain SL491) TaxID=465517 RepID=A0A6C8F083_SALV4|nr:hypothetical protein SeV_B0393 [Salmonella enterica subsp. enterica serovar Virchow str. SL491]
MLYLVFDISFADSMMATGSYSFDDYLRSSYTQYSFVLAHHMPQHNL